MTELVLWLRLGLNRDLGVETQRGQGKWRSKQIFQE
jgi:hypothetical protein